jgi:DNA repair protein RadC
MKKAEREKLESFIKNNDLLGAADFLAEKSKEYGIDQISQPDDAVGYFRKWRYRRQEFFLVATLDGAHHVLKIHEVTKGILNRTLIHPREVFRLAILDAAAAAILCHNHPSGKAEPSAEDNEITRRMIGAGKAVGIAVLDHIILGHSDHFSFLKDQGEIFDE